MPRPRKGVTLENLYPVDSYFYRALKDNRLFEENDVGWELNNKAGTAFKKLPTIDRSNHKTKQATTEQRRVALQKWVDKYIPPDKWQRCLMTLRQNKSRKKLKLRNIHVTQEVYFGVQTLAERTGLTMGEVIYKVTQAALDKLHAEEIASEAI